METGKAFVYSAPAGALQAARLICTSIVRGVRLEACEGIGELYQARFHDSQPILNLKEGVLTVQPGPPFPGENHLIELCLNSTVLWEIEFRGGAQSLQADLRIIRLNSLDILGDARQVELYLPRPEGASFLYVSGNLRDAAFYRPAGVGMRLNVSGGVEKCSFDHQIIHAVRAETSLESRDFSPKDGYYHLTVSGSVRSVTFTDSAERATENR